MRARFKLSDVLSVNCRSMEVPYDLPDFRRRMLSAERRSGNQIFAHCQSADDDGLKTNLSDEARRDISSVRVVAADRNPERAANTLPIIREIQASGVTTLRGVARALTARGVPSARGTPWSPVAVSNIIRRSMEKSAP
jgi:hypothetical protein